MNHHLSRSAALNNIPQLKIQEKFGSLFSNCELCSKRSSQQNNAVDGICSKCSLITIAYNRYAESNIPLSYWNIKMEKDFVGDKNLLNKYNDFINDLKNNYINGTSICFAGFHGVGKSFAMACILKKAVQKGYTCLYTTLSDIVNTLTQASNEEKFLARKELTMVDFLVIDEFDPRFIPTENAADLYARTLEGIFRTRAQNKLPTLMATNSPNVIETFTGPLKQSISSLMKGYLSIFPVLGEDYRSKSIHIKEVKDSNGV